MNKPLTTTKLAQMLNVTASTIRNWEQQGLITSTRTTGGHRRFSQEEINRLTDGKPQHEVGALFKKCVELLKQIKEKL